MRPLFGLLISASLMLTHCRTVETRPAFAGGRQVLYAQNLVIDSQDGVVISDTLSGPPDSLIKQYYGVILDESGLPEQSFTILQQFDPAYKKARFKLRFRNTEKGLEIGASFVPDLRRLDMDGVQVPDALVALVLIIPLTGAAIGLLADSLSNSADLGKQIVQSFTNRSSPYMESLVEIRKYQYSPNRLLTAVEFYNADHSGPFAKIKFYYHQNSSSVKTAIFTNLQTGQSRNLIKHVP
ncbi:MAG: hypothetical protein KDK39_08550 [Leptospiraceae bacterium]|nr:hypothetical protein [Leptospiraceae bacterium]